MQTLSYDPDTLYFNIRMTNTINNNPYSIPAQYESTSQNNPIIGDPSKYYVAVTDFSCPGESIPIGVARVIPNTNDINLSNDMTSVIAITYNNVINEQRLIFQPSTNLNPPIQNQRFQIITPYYYIYSYQQIIDSINVALRAACIAAGIVEDNIDTNQYPYFFIDYSKDLPKIKIVISKELINDANFQGISINNELINYLGGFNYIYNNNKDERFLDFIFIPPIINNTLGDAANNSYYYKPYICDQSGNYIVGETIASANYFAFEQQNYLLPQWNCLSKIIIYTQSIPVRNQQTTSRITDSPDIVNKYPVLFSFTPEYETSAQARNYIYYNAKENYTLTELLSNSPLSKIQISIAWVDHNGEVFPLYLNSYQSCNVQLGFFKKEMYKSKN